MSRIVSVTFVNTEKSRLCLPLGTYKESTTAFPVDHLPGSAKCLSQSTFTLSCSGLSFRAIVRVGAKGVFRYPQKFGGSKNKDRKRN